MPNQITVKDLLKEWNEKFTGAKIAQPKESIEYIIAHVLIDSTIPSDVYNFLNDVVSESNKTRVNDLCAERMERIPIQYIIKKWKFRNLILKMSPPVFVPWDVTEKFVDISLDIIDSVKPKTVLELCCGSGAISLALLNERPELKIITVDKSKDACNLTKENADLLKLSDRIKVIHSRISQNGEIKEIDEKFDVIVSNPPYVLPKEFDTLGPEIIIYADVAAVYGGDDGMFMIKPVLFAASRMLNKGGKLAMEVNPLTWMKIEPLLQEHKELGLTFVKSYKDSYNLDRYVEIVKN